MTNHSNKPILLYHKIDPRWEVGVTNVFPGTFRKQMSLAYSQDKKLLPLETAITSDDPNVIGLTFDDGYTSIGLHALPILSEFRFTGTVFLITDAIGKSNRWEAQLAWRTFYHLDNSSVFGLLFAGWRIGSHGVSHTAFTLLNDEQARLELIVSKDILEQRFGHPIVSFAFPFGRYCAHHLEMALEAGYQWLCVAPLRGELAPGISKHVVYRRPIYFGDSLSRFSQMLEPRPLTDKELFRIRLANRLAGGTIIVQKFRKIF